MTVEEVLQMHETRLRNWIENNIGASVPEENFYREIVSGETISERKEFQKVLKRIEDGKIRAVLCLECSRLSRGDMEDCGRIMKLFRYTHTLIIDEQQNRVYDLQDEFDREGFEREIKHSNYYLEYSKKLMKRGLDYAVTNGAFVASAPPYGYRKIRVQVGKKKMSTLEIVEEEAKVVRMIFDWYVNEDIGASKIAYRLDAMGIKPRKVDVWCPMSIRKIVGNEHYIGKIRYYAHKMDYQVCDQKIIKKKVRVEDYQLFDGMHEAIIDEELFNRAKKKKESFPRIKKNYKIRNPFASILYCECGHAMTFAIKRGIGRFECPEQRRCNNASIDAEQFIAMISDALKKSMEDFSVEIGGTNEDVYIKHQEKIASLEKRLKDIEYKELSLWEKYTEEKMPKTVFDNLRKKFEDERENVESLLQNAISETPQRIDYEERVATLHEAIEALNDNSISAEIKNPLLRACMERINYTRPKSIRGDKKDVKEGQSYDRGWIQSEPHIDITLRM